MLEAAQETAKLGENLMSDELLEMDAAMTASMAALNSALALEESVLHQDTAVTLPAVDAAALLGPGPAGQAALGDPVSALGGRSSVDTSALINAAALLGPGAGGLLPTSAQPNLLPGADAWDEMEKRMAALQATLEDPGGEGAIGSAAQDEARLAARAARMREREAKRQAKRAGTQHVPATGGMSAATATLASHAAGASGYGMQPAAPVAPSPGGRVVIQPGVVRRGVACAVLPLPLLVLTPRAFTPLTEQPTPAPMVPADAAKPGLTMTASAALNAQRERDLKEAEERQRQAEAARRETAERDRRALAAAEAAAKAEQARIKSEQERAARAAKDAEKIAKRAAMAERERSEPGSGPNMKRAVATGDVALFREQCRACAERALVGTSRLPCMIADGAPEAVLQGLRSHSTDADAVREACAALKALAGGDDRKRMRPFCEASINVVRAALDAHPDNGDVALAGYWALAALVVHVHDKPSVGATLQAAMAGDPLNAALAEVGCATLKNAALGEDVNRSSALDNGALDSILEALRTHSGQAGVCEQACGALKNMCVLPACQAKVAEMGGIEDLLSVLGTHARSTGPCEQAVWALRILAFSPDNAAAIAEAGGIGLVVDTQKAHIGHAGVQETCCGALRTFAAHASNKMAVLEAGAPVRAVAAMRRHAGAPAVQMAGCGLLSALVWDQDAQKKTAAAGGVEVLVEAVRNNPKATKLHQAALAVLTSLAAANAETKARAAAAGAVDAACDCLAAHVQLGPEAPPGVAEAALAAIATVVASPEAQRGAVESEAIKRVLAAMRLHRNSPEVAEKACRALSAVVWCLPQAQKAARKAGLLDDLMGAMNAFPEHRGVQKAARALMTTVQVEADDDGPGSSAGGGAGDARGRSRTDPGIASLSLRNPNPRYTSM